MAKIILDLCVVEELFQMSTASRKIYPCSTLMVELKQSMETYMSVRLVRGGFISMKTAFNHCVNEMMTEDARVLDEDSWSGAGF